VSAVITAGCAPQPKCLSSCAITSALTYASQQGMWKVSTRGPMDLNEFIESEAQTGTAGDELVQRIGHRRFWVVAIEPNESGFGGVLVDERSGEILHSFGTR
jgi:hypothetical protein